MDKGTEEAKILAWLHENVIYQHIKEDVRRRAGCTQSLLNLMITEEEKG